MRPVIRMHACNYDCSAAHGAQWQELEIIFGRLLQHRNMRERRVQLTSIWYKHAKRRVRYVYIRKHLLAYFLYSETLTRMRVLQEDDICFTLMVAIFK